MRTLRTNRKGGAGQDVHISWADGVTLSMEILQSYFEFQTSRRLHRGEEQSRETLKATSRVDFFGRDIFSLTYPIAAAEACLMVV